MFIDWYISRILQMSADFHKSLFVADFLIYNVSETHYVKQFNFWPDSWLKLAKSFHRMII